MSFYHFFGLQSACLSVAVLACLMWSDFSAPSNSVCLCILNGEDVSPTCKQHVGCCFLVHLVNIFYLGLLKCLHPRLLVLCAERFVSFCLFSGLKQLHSSQAPCFSFVVFCMDEI